MTNSPDISRRRFVQGLMGSGLVLSSGIGKPLHAMDQERVSVISSSSAELSIGYTPVNKTGQERIATTVNHSLPAPILRWQEGERVRIRVRNDLAEDSSIHWHGIILPSNMDGVPGLSFDGIKPGESYLYEFTLKQSGTYWYHGHSGFQEQTGLYGAIVIDPIEQRYARDREHVIVLSDWSDENPHNIYSTLKKQSEYFNTNRRTLSNLFDEINDDGLRSTFNARQMWNQMRMSDRDLLDVTGYTYTYLMNGMAPSSQWTALYEPGETVLLRIINGSAMSFFDFRIPGLKMTVVAADGQDVEPVTVDEIRIGTAETYDVLVKPGSDMAYALFAQAMDRTGYALGRLTDDHSLYPRVPDLDPVPVLSHSDMGMGQGHDHHHASTGSGISHASTEYGPHVDMRVDNPRDMLGDPGPGLRNNGRKVLTYGELSNISRQDEVPEPDLEIELHLTGNMHRYIWSFNGIKFADSEPLIFNHGERIRITLINDTMMNHPIHLHGLWSELETGEPDHMPKKHTVIVQPGSRITYQVLADSTGRWAYHCHLMYHMLGMFREVRII